MAIEDAEALRLLTPSTTTEQVPEILRAIDRVRSPRTRQVLESTRHMKHGMTSEERLGQVVENFQFNCRYAGIYEALAAME